MAVVPVIAFRIAKLLEVSLHDVLQAPRHGTPGTPEENVPALRNGDPLAGACGNKTAAVNDVLLPSPNEVVSEDKTPVTPATDGAPQPALEVSASTEAVATVPDYQAKQREKRRIAAAAGWCSQCCIRPMVPGKRRCQLCTDRSNALNRKKSAQAAQAQGVDPNLHRHCNGGCGTLIALDSTWRFCPRCLAKERKKRSGWRSRGDDAFQGWDELP